MKVQNYRSYDPLKRALDISLSSLVLLWSLPVQGVVALAVIAKLGRPVMFRQSRPGLNGKPFTMLKFRSMAGPDVTRGIVTDEQRLGRFGIFLRSTSLDELPSLWNVVRGDMSLVGPRPLLEEYLPLYDAFQSRRHEVRPGITGLAQVSGRNAVTWESKFAYDVAYVEERSLLLDLQILTATVRKVIARKDISSAAHLTMPRFTGVIDSNFVGWAD